MKIGKWVLGLALMAMVTVSAFAQKYDAESDFVVSESGNGVVITAYKGKNKKIQIPPKIQGKPVIGIASSSTEPEAVGVFQNKGLTSVIIPDSVITVGRRAFRGNKLTNVTIPNGVVTIGADAFRDNRLTSVTIPDSVTAIGADAFRDNRLTSVTIPDSVTTIWHRAFSYNRLTSVTIGNSVTTIEDGAFMKNQLTGVTIPISVTSIGANAFYENRITSVTIVSGTTIGDKAFGEAKITFRQLEYDREGDFKVRISGNGVIITSYTGGRTEIRIFSEIQGKPVIGIDKGAFKNKRLTSVTIPDGVTSIGVDAFMGNKLTSVVIPNSVTIIENSAFRSNELTSVVIPNSVTIIENSAFRSNELTSITIPNSVTTIGDYAFATNYLTRITIPDSVTRIGIFAFAGNNLISISVLNGTSIGEGAFGRYLVTLRPSQADIAARQIYEAEKLKTKEQILRMVRLDGTYINTRTQTAGHGGILPNQHVYAIRFFDKLLNTEELESIRAQVIYDTGDRRGDVVNFFECFLEGSNLYYQGKEISLLYTVTNNKNSLQARTASGNTVNFEFRPHPPVAGKTYIQFSDNRNSYSFVGSNFTSLNVDGRSAFRGPDYTYDYSEGVVTLKWQGNNLYRYLFLMGPFLIPSHAGPVYVQQ